MSLNVTDMRPGRDAQGRFPEGSGQPANPLAPCSYEDRQTIDRWALDHKVEVKVNLAKAWSGHNYGGSEFQATVEVDGGHWRFAIEHRQGTAFRRHIPQVTQGLPAELPASSKRRMALLDRCNEAAAEVLEEARVGAPRICPFCGVDMRREPGHDPGPCAPRMVGL